MAIRVVDSEQDRRKRELRLRIGRLRRRIDLQTHRTTREVRRLASWRTYVTHFPGSAVIGALGVGLALSGGLGLRSLSRWLGMRLVRRGVDAVVKHFCLELGRIWADSAPDANPPDADGADNGRA